MTWYLNPPFCSADGFKKSINTVTYTGYVVLGSDSLVWDSAVGGPRLTRFFLFSCSKATNRLVQVVLQTYW